MNPFPMIALAVVATAAGCSTTVATGEAGKPHRESVAPLAVSPSVAQSGNNLPVSGRPAMALPKAGIYRMTGPYADNVPITLGPDGHVISYPAPTDISEAQRPLPLRDGWWLDRRGVREGSVFTRYTYAEYAALKEAPSPEALKQAVIPGARVTDVTQLPITLEQALADTAAISRYIPAPLKLNLK